MRERILFSGCVWEFFAVEARKETDGRIFQQIQKKLCYNQ